MSEDTNVNEGRSPKEIVKDVVSQYVQAKPTRVSLKLYWDDKRSTISINGDNLNQIIERPQTIDFTSFAHGVLDVYKEVYGELEIILISFREETYRNDKVSLDLYPTGSAGIFDIFVSYK